MWITLQGYIATYSRLRSPVIELRQQLCWFHRGTWALASRSLGGTCDRALVEEHDDESVYSFRRHGYERC